MKTVQILMSTYNGEQYLEEQIDSILNQDCEEKGIASVELLIRDDGSKDGTQRILEKYAKKYAGKIFWYQGENKGVIDSFFDLLRKSDCQADYWGFADQDDYWLPEKVGAGVEQLERETPLSPNLYCCPTTLVDEQLQKLESSIKRGAVRPSFGNALVENIVPGCTIMMNPSLRELVLLECPEYTAMHDWWFYLVASCFGNVVYDRKSYILYRQHGKNAVGSSVSRWRELVGRIKRYKGNRGKISRQVTEFLRIYHRQRIQDVSEKIELCVNEDDLLLAGQLIEGKNKFTKRLKLVRQKKIYRQRKNDNRIFQIILLKGSY